MAKASIVMVTCDRMSMVHEMMDDIASQTYKGYEYIIVDNASSDNTLELLEKKRQADTRVSIIRLDNRKSVGAARNIGVRASVGEYVAFVDDDDRVSKDYIESHINLMEDYNADASIVGIEESIHGEIHPQIVFDGIMEFTGEEAVIELVRRNRIRAGLPCKMFKRHLLINNPIKEDCRHEDVSSTYRLLGNAHKVVMNGRAKYIAVRHDGNLSAFNDLNGTMDADQLREYLTAYIERRDWLNERFPDNKALWDYSVWSFEISMVHKYAESVSKKQGTIEEMLVDLKANYQRIMQSDYLNENECSVLEGLKEVGEL